MRSKFNPLFLPIPNLRYRLWSEVALAAMMIMELSWIIAWYNTIARPSAGLAVIILVLASGLFISHWLARFMRAHQWRIALRRAIFLFWLIIYLFLSLKVLLYSQVPLSPLELVKQPLQTIFSGQSGDQDFWHILVLSLLVLRGINLSNAPVDQHRVSGSFQLGLLMYLIFGIANSQSHPIATISILFFYLFISLLGLSAAGIADLGDLRGGKLPRFGSGWSLGIILACSGVVGLAVLLGWTISSKFVLQMISEFASVIITVLIFLLTLVMIPLLLLTQAVLNFLKDYIFRLFALKIFEDLANLLGKQVSQQQENIHNMVQVNIPFHVIVILGVLLIVLLAILVALQARPRRRRLIGEETSQVIDGSNLKFKIPGILQTSFARLSKGRRWLAAAQIRRIYAQLLALCDKLGKPRPTAATPLEFLQTLEMLFPGENTRLTLVTQAYLKVRYGELPESPQEVQAVVDSWNHIKSRGYKALQEKKPLNP